MKLVKKLVIIAIVLLIIAVIAAVMILPSYLNGIVEQGIETYGPQATGTAVTVEKVDLAPFSGAGSVTSFVVANPEGFHTDGAIKVGEASIKLDPGTLLKEVVVINDISIDGAELTYELGGKGSNIGVIQKHIESVLGKGGESDESQTKVVIDRFSLKNCTVRVGATLLKGKAKTINLPDIELKDIGRKSAGITAVEAAAQVMNHVIGQASKAVIANGINLPDIKLPNADNLKKTVEDKLKKPLGKLKGLFGK